MRLNNWSIAASYDTARIFAGLGFGSSTASRSTFAPAPHRLVLRQHAGVGLCSGSIRHFKRRVMGGMSGAPTPFSFSAATSDRPFPGFIGKFAASAHSRFWHEARFAAVERAVSSMNAGRAGSNMPWSRIQRRRARATSARFCSTAYRVFFEADVAPGEEPPHRAAAAGDPAFAHRHHDLVQRQVGLVGNLRQQKFRVLLQRRGAAAARLCRYASGLLEPLHPYHHHARAEPIAFGRLTPRSTPYPRLQSLGHASRWNKDSASLAPKNKSIPGDSLI